MHNKKLNIGKTVIIDILGPCEHCKGVHEGIEFKPCVNEVLEKHDNEIFHTHQAVCAKTKKLIMLDLRNYNR